MFRRVAIGIAATITIDAGAVQAQVSTSTTPPESTAPTAPATSQPPVSTTIAPTTTLDPVATEEQAVTTAATQAHAAALELFAAPDDPAAIAALDEFYVAGSTARATIETQAQQLADAGTRVRENPDAPGSFTVEDVTLADGPPSTSADLTVCVVLSWVEYAATPASSVPDTSDHIVAERLTARRATYHLVNGDDDHWRIDTTNVVATFDDQSSCPVDPIAAEEALISQRVQEIDAIRWNAYFNPDAPGTAEALDSIYTDESQTRQVVESDLQALRDEGWVVRPNPELPQTITVEEVRLLDGPPSTRAEAVVCVVDSTILVDPAALPDGSDSIISDEVLAIRAVQHLTLEGGIWQVDDVNDLGEWLGAAACPVD